MTANLILMLCFQTAVFLAVWNMVQQKSGASVAWLSLASFCVLPLCFGAITVISHMVFEFTPEFLFWILFTLAAGIAVVTLERLRRAGSGLRPVFRRAVQASLGFSIISLAIGIPVHAYESGPTPRLMASPTFICALLASSAVVAALICAIWALAEGPHLMHRVVRFALVPLLAAILLAELLSSLFT